MRVWLAVYVLLPLICRMLPRSQPDGWALRQDVQGAYREMRRQWYDLKHDMLGR